MLPLEYKIFSGIVLFLLIVNSFLKREKAPFVPDVEIFVPDIHCANCKFTLEEGIKKLPGVDGVEVIVAKKLVKVKGEINKNDILKAIKQLGYSPRT